MKTLQSTLMVALVLVACSDKDDPQPQNLEIFPQSLYGEWDHEIINTSTVPATCESSIEESNAAVYGSKLTFFEFSGGVKMYDHNLCMNSFKQQYFIGIEQNQIRVKWVKNNQPYDSLIYTFNVEKLTDSELHFTITGESYQYKFKKMD